MVSVIISNRARRQLKAAIEYIHQQSTQNAEAVKEAIIQAISRLPENPEQYPPDKYRLHNDGCFRAFETMSYRVTYHVTGKKITVIRIRHVKMNPRYY